MKLRLRDSVPVVLGRLSTWFYRFLQCFPAICRRFLVPSTSSDAQRVVNSDGRNYKIIVFSVKKYNRSCQNEKNGPLKQPKDIFETRIDWVIEYATCKDLPCHWISVHLILWLSETKTYVVLVSTDTGWQHISIDPKSTFESLKVNFRPVHWTEHWYHATRLRICCMTLMICKQLKK